MPFFTINNTRIDFMNIIALKFKTGISVLFPGLCRIRFLRILLPVCLFFGSMFLTADRANADIIRIAAIFSQTGIAAPHNQPLLPVIELAVDEINRSGGILNNPIQLILLDNQSSPIGSKLAAEQAVKMNVTAVIGAHWSSHSLAMAPVLQKAKIPMIAPGSTHPDVTKAGDYIFRACFLDSFQGMAMARFARDELKAKKAAIIRNIDETYSIMLAEFFKNAFIKFNGKVLIDDGYRGNAIDFANLIKKIKTAAPDIIYLPGYSRDSGLFIRQARQLGVTAVFLGGDAWDEIETYSKDTVRGSFQSAPWHPQVPFPKSAHLKKLYFDRYKNEINNMSVPLAYDAVLLLAEAIERAGSLDREKIKNALADIKAFQGATGLISFDENGDPKNKDVIIIKFDDKGRSFYKTIKP